MEYCAACGESLRPIKDKPYIYDECGLNVVLHGITQYQCAKCGETYAAIPHMQKLNRLIGSHICEKGKALLLPEEIRFLRKDLHLKAKDLAKILGVTPSTLSRWENGKKEIGEAHDRLLRSLYMMYACERDHRTTPGSFLQVFRDLPATRKEISQPREISINPQEWLTRECRAA